MESPNVAWLLLISCALTSTASRGIGFLKGAVVLDDTNTSDRFTNADLKPQLVPFRREEESSRDRWETHPWKLSTKTCGETVKVTSADKRDLFCPPDCPYYAQDRTDREHCTFLCVSAANCAVSNPNKPVADFELGACRGPQAHFCKKYNFNGTDTCIECQASYRLGDDGKCHYKYYFLLYTLLVVFVAIVSFLVVWVVDLLRRPTTNHKGLQQGLDNREDQKLRQPANEEGQRHLWPIGATNLTHQNVAGAGMMLHFNFQKWIIVWALIVGVLWALIASFVDWDLFVLGTNQFGTHRDNCILVAWGWETQHRLMWTKIYFVAVVYICSFIACIVFAVHQLRLFQVFERDNQTQKDFSAMCVGLPILSGCDKVEEELQKIVEAASEQKVIGVSICWDYKDNEDTILDALDHTLDKFAKAFEQQDRVRSRRPSNSNSVYASESERGALAIEHSVLRRSLIGMENKIFGGDDEVQEGAEERESRFSSLLKEFTSSQNAVVVFESEGARDAAVARVAETKGFQYKDTIVDLQVQEVEPDTIIWRNFGHASTLQKIGRLSIGMGCIVFALFFWTTVFYAPYAWSIFHFNYDNGQEPGFVYGIAFSMVVVVGNAIMYETCNRVSTYVGFRNDGRREACYVILYTIACTFNILMDMVTTYFMALYIMQGLDFRTYEGTKLSDLTEFHEQFETYAMQRSLAQNTFAYAFPSTFLIPFLIEPIVTIVLPLRVGMLLVRSHPEMLGRTAEGWLAAAPMDLGRYGDLLLDVVLGILIFYFPGGYTHTLFFAMAACHIYIYFFDHIKVLTVIPCCDYASIDIDWWAQAMLAPCCALMLSCLVFKAQCQGYGYCLSGTSLVAACTMAFFAHCVVHIFLLLTVVPLFGRKEPDEHPDVSYKDFAKTTACTYFSSNPVHCLRSHFIFDHRPPCTFFETGKEHLIEVNEKIGCYFSSDEACNYDMPPRSAFEHIKGVVKQFSGQT